MPDQPVAVAGVLPLESLCLKVNPVTQKLESADPEGFVGWMI
jgi:hypothetical protein